jgi:hypothetical protein
MSTGEAALAAWPQAHRTPAEAAPRVAPWLRVPELPVPSTSLLLS